MRLSLLREVVGLAIDTEAAAHGVEQVPVDLSLQTPEIGILLRVEQLIELA